MSLGDDLIARFIDDPEEAGANIAKTKTIREGRDLTTILSQKWAVGHSSPEGGVRGTSAKGGSDLRAVEHRALHRRGRGRLGGGRPSAFGRMMPPTALTSRARFLEEELPCCGFFRSTEGS